MNELTVEARLDNLEKVIDFISRNLEEAGGSPAIEIQVHLAVEEIFVNVASYAYEPGTGPVTIQCGPLGSDRFEIIFIDQGVPYDSFYLDNVVNKMLGSLVKKLRDTLSKYANTAYIRNH